MEKKISLRNINLQIHQGTLNIIIGSVGSGKTLLMNVITSCNMKKIKGIINVSTNAMSWVSQEPFLFCDTIKNNILFYSHFDEDRFNHIIKATTLGKDMNNFPNGIDTVIGENGLMLSGGQKVRLSLARALYKSSDVFLFDDILSALDISVGKEVFEKVIMKFLKGKTIVIIMHQMEFLKYADNVYVMEDGTIRKIKENENPFTFIDKKDTNEIHKKVKKEIKVRISSGRKFNTIHKEEKKKGKIKIRTYWRYLLAMTGNNFFVTILLVFFLSLLFITNVLVSSGSKIWLTMWSNPSNQFEFIHTFITYGNTTISWQSYSVFAILGITSISFIFISNFMYFTLGLCAAFRLHKNALGRLFHATKSFLDGTPIGRIVSRFSKDIENIDTHLPFTLCAFIDVLGQVVEYCFLICYGGFGFGMIPIIIVIIVFLLLHEIYKRVYTLIKRCKSVSTSPIFANFSETLKGATTIYTYKMANNFIKKNEKLLDLNQKPTFILFAMKSWLHLRLELIGTVFVFVLCWFTIILCAYFSFDTSRASLIITFSIFTCFKLAFAVKWSADIESYMNDVERLSYYADKVPIERNSKVNFKKELWPSKGSIQFVNYSMKYRSELPLTLKDLSFEIRGGKRTAIIGRTGSGKSSILHSLLRTIEAHEGMICIDGKNISDLNVQYLRSKIFVISQDPVLFSGTIRDNIVPKTSQKRNISDAEIWECLEKVGMKEKIYSKEKKLDFLVEEKGKNFSCGEKQLLCLARALFSEARIIFLDEYSSNVDNKTAQVIQNTIDEFFNGCTIISICHRIKMIRNYDEVIVMKDGCVKEMGSPKEIKSELFVSVLKQ